MAKLQSHKKVIVFHLLVNISIVFFITGASYVHVPLEGFRDTAIYFLHLCALQTTIAGVIYFLSLFKLVFRVVFSFLFIVYCLFSFWAYTQDMSITPSLLQAIFETKTDIAVDLITWPYFLFVGVAVWVLFFILKFYKNLEARRGWKLFIIPAALCVLLFFVVENKRPGSLKNRLPYNLVYGIDAFYEIPQLQLNHEIHKSEVKTERLKLVFVLGETVRADHLSINGYDRETTPKISERNNIISFSKLYTKHTYTGASVPQLLTNQSLQDTIGPYTTFYSIAKKAGYQTTWIGNQTLEKSYAPVVETNEEVILIDEYKSEFSFAKALDEELLKPMDSVLKRSDKELITLHMIGSHWWYENRYTEEFRKYTPVIDSKYVPSLSAEKMINSYDNTLLYLDTFLDAVIVSLEQETVPAVMVYVSDHGEHLGENGKWLHAQAGEEVKNPAYLIWYSESYKALFPEKIETLCEGSSLSTPSDVVFHTVLDLLDINFKLAP